MTYIACSTPSLPAPPPPRGGRIRRVIRRLAPVLVPALMVSALGCREDAQSPTAPESGPALDIQSAAALSFRQVSVAWLHTCGVTTDNRAYCWGENTYGQLGNGTTNDSPTPVPVAGGLFFRQVVTGTHGYTCGIALNDLTYCWGVNNVGQLGDGTTTQRLMPTRVQASGLRFRRVTADAGHTCAETGDSRAFCWGYNSKGQLGTGTNTGPEICSGEFACSTRPVAVSGGRRFSHVNASPLHTCGVTPLGEAFCWGDNSAGQLGTGTNTGPQMCGEFACSTTPVRVAGGLEFRQIDGATWHTCGVTTDNRAHCWGRNERGRLGTGTFNQSQLTPTTVKGGIRFRVVSAGAYSTCGITPENLAYCWGYGGTLGDGTNTDRRLPVPVIGGLHFRQMDDRPAFGTCAVSTDHVVYCWGREPVAVPGPA